MFNHHNGTGIDHTGCVDGYTEKWSSFDQTLWNNRCGGKREETCSTECWFCTSSPRRAALVEVFALLFTGGGSECSATLSSRIPVAHSYTVVLLFCVRIHFSLHGLMDSHCQSVCDKEQAITSNSPALFHKSLCGGNLHFVHISPSHDIAKVDSRGLHTHSSQHVQTICQSHCQLSNSAA